MVWGKKPTKTKQINFSENDKEEKNQPKTFAQARKQVKTVLQQHLEGIKHCKFNTGQKTNSTVECRSIAYTIKQSFSSI